jgi:hypothetical protein
LVLFGLSFLIADLLNFFSLNPHDISERRQEIVMECFAFSSRRQSSFEEDAIRFIIRNFFALFEEESK